MESSMLEKKLVKPLFKLLLTVATILILVSCTKEDPLAVSCECSKTVYQTQQYAVVQNGLPSLRTRRVVLNIEKNIGCQPEGIIFGGSGISYETKCFNY